MSHPFYNPYAPGNHNPTQGQYGHSNTPPERDPRGPPSFLGPGSRFSSFGASPVIPENSGQTVSASLNYRPEPSRAIRDEDTKSSIDMHIGRAREGAWPPGTPLHQPMDQGTRFTSTQRDDFRSPGASYAMTTASASLGHKHEVDIGSGSSNLNRLTNYIRPSTDGSILKSSSALSNYARIADGRLNNPDEREHGMQTIPGLGDYDRSASDKPASSTEPFQPMYTYESAASILLQFGLEKEDLEHLISYPEDQITPANLPFILRQIRLQKDKSAATAVQSKAYLEPQLTRTMSSGGAVDKTSSAVLQPSNVIDYGHTSKYAAGVGDEIGRKIDRDNSGGSGNLFVMDTDERHCREPLQINTPEFKSSALGSSSEQARSSTTLSSMYGSVLRPVDSPSSDQTKPWQVQPKRTFQDILNSFSQLKKDSDMSALKSEASKLASLSQQEVHPQSILKTQPPSTRTHGTHPSRPGLVLIGSKTPGQRPTVPVKSHQASQQPIQQTQKQPVKKAKNQSLKQVSKQPVQKQPLKQQQSKKQMQQHQKHPVSQKGQVLPTGVLARLVKLATSKGQPKNEAVVSKDQPTPEMMFDYAAASPRIFPHTCVLCNKECTDLKDWIAHQNSSLHLESCTRLRKQYPKWDGGITLGPRAAGKDAKTPSSTSAKKTRHGSRSRSKSVSPHRRRGSEGRRDKRRSRSRSPQSSKYSGRYDGPATSSYRSRSQSPERRSSPRRKDDRQSSPRRTRDRRSPLRRSNESWSPPRNRWSPPRKGDAIRGDERWTPPRRPEGGWSPLRRASERQSPSRRSSDSRSPTRRVESRWSPPKRFDKRRSPQRRVDDRWSPPRRAGGGRSPPGRSAGSRSPPGRSQERRSSREGSSPQRKASNSAESLAKKLLETSAAQSLSNKSDLETMVKTLAPALLAELAKMTSSSSSSSSLKGGKRSLPASSLRRKKLSSSAASSTFSSSAAKRKRSATIPSKAMRLLKSEASLNLRLR
ncbi:serine/arginine repetitive matrix protein 2-like [Labrus bergylta]|uniref:serine/arginine repetitive matrix protein 2-like n=1 Tax=Labrus bergylta TaxID=56723 RepID=UPI0033131A50